MLVPRTPLLILVALLAVPLAAVGVMEPDGLPGIGLICGLVLGLAALDGALAAARTGGLRVELPEVVRLAKDRAGAVPFFVRNDRPGAPARTLRLGLALPAEIESPDETTTVRLAAGAARTRFDWPCTPRRRGRFALDRFHYEEASVLRLWGVRRRAAVAGELRVYPDLFAERRHAPALFLRRGGLGIHARRQVGRGREFEKLRDYVPGDSIEDISWKATARRRKPISKVFQVERTQEVYVLLDNSRLSARPVPEADGGKGNAKGRTVTALERNITAALMLCLAAERQADLFGLATFSDRVGRFLRARGGQGHFNQCRDALYTLEPSLVSPDFEELCAFLRVRLRRRALLVFLTALDDPVLAESFTKQIELLSRQHLVLVGMLRPPDARPIFSGDPAQVRGADDVYRALGGHLQWQKLRERENLLRRQGVGFTLLDGPQMTNQLVSQYADIKQRQIL